MSRPPENPSKDDMLQMIVDNYRLNNGFVCPYAQLTATVKTLPTCETPEDAEMFHSMIEDGLREFHTKNTASLIFIVPVHPTNHEEGREQTENIFAHLRVAALCISHGTLIDPRKNNRSFSIIPFGKDKLLTIGLNQLYPEQHPRYSPEPIVAVTRISDVLKLSEDQTFSIRQKAIRRLIHAHLPELSNEEVTQKTTITQKIKRNDIDVEITIDDSIATPEVLKAAQTYGMNVPLYLMPEPQDEPGPNISR